jgi:hypothetical protein
MRRAVFVLIAVLATHALVVAGAVHYHTTVHRTTADCDPIAPTSCTSESTVPVITPQQRTGYDVFSEFIVAVQDQNYTGAASLLSDEGNYVITDVICGELLKQQFIDAIKSAKLASFQVVLGAWTETMGNLTLARAEISAIFGPDHPWPYSTYNNPNVYLVIQTTLNKKQLYSIQMWTDSGMRQTNTSLMLNVFDTVLSADRLGNLASWDPILSADFTFAIYRPFDDHFPIWGNRTAFDGQLSEQYGNQSSNSVSVRSVFVVCEYVAADVSVFYVDKQAKTHVHKLFLTLRLNDKMQIYFLQQWYFGRY